MSSAMQLGLHGPEASGLRDAQGKLINCAIHQTAISLPKSNNELFF